MQPGASAVDLSAFPARAPFAMVAPPSSPELSSDVRGQAHDINNKLAAVLGFAELLQRPGIDSAKVGTYAASIHRAAWSCAEIARSMLAPHGATDAARPAVDLHQVVLDELSLVAGTLLQRGINLLMNRAPGQPRVRIDATELSRVVANLVDNARDALLCHALLAPPVAPQVVVTTRLESSERVSLSVSDNGPGIPEESFEQVWRQGYSTKPVAASEQRGFGLAVVRGVVERAGGRVELESQPGRGTTFHLHLPLA